MANETKFSSTDFRVASFSCYLKPRENKQNPNKFSHIFRRAGLCLTKKPVDAFAFPDLTNKPTQFEEKSRKSYEELMSIAYDDVASDASSDLFEIEIFSRNGSFSEFSSSYSDYDEKRTIHTTATCQTPPVKNKTGMSRKPQKTTATNWLGCKSQHSVKVAETIYKTSNKSKH